jgi:hypothetical protein
MKPRRRSGARSANLRADHEALCDAARLEWINRIYSERGLLPLAKADPSGRPRTGAFSGSL